MTLHTEQEGQYLNVYKNGELIVSVSEDHDEIVVYDGDDEEPLAVHEIKCDEDSD